MRRLSMVDSCSLPIFIGSIVLLVLLAGCTGGERSSDAKTPPSAGVTAGAPASGSAAGASDAVQGTVLESMDAGRYTIILVQTAEDTMWVAGPLTPIKPGENVLLPTGLMMKDFKSPTLKRTFETIYFVSTFNAADAAGGGNPHAGVDRGESGMSSGSGNPVVDRKDVGKVEKAPGGFTIGEIYENKADLRGKPVTIRGVVVKFTPAIMGMNWIHLQDGTGSDGSGDLTVTTDAAVKVGDVVLLQGILAVDKDFGSGYRYEVIIEGAKLLGQ